MSNDPIDMVEVDGQLVVSKVALKTRIIKFIKFATKFSIKHKLALAIAAAVFLALLAVYNAMPTVGVGNLEMTNLNTKTRVKLGQTVKLKYDNVSVTIDKFLNDPCPEGQKCYGSGQFADYKFTVNGKGYFANSLSTAKAEEYSLETVSSDYETYADIIITKLK